MVNVSYKNTAGTSSLSSKLEFFAEYPIFCFVPYLFVYLVGWGLKLPLLTIEKAFWGLHLINLLGILFIVKAIYKKIEWLEWLFWTILFVVLWNRGAYLEYPSDPWDHFRRITLWNDYSTIAENPYKNRIPYFFAWTFLKYFSPLDQRQFLNFYSAVWQWLFTYQFARFFLKMGIKRENLIPYVLGTIVFFGTGMMSFRYYMLSGVPLGYIAYLSALGICLSDKNRFRFYFGLKITLLAILMVFGHPETFIFFAVSVTALILCHFFLDNRYSVKLGILVLIVYLVSLVGGNLLYRFTLFPFNLTAHRYEWSLQLSRFSTFRMWGLESKFFETVALPGLLTLLASPFVFKKNPRLVVLTLFPVFLLLFPPVVLIIVKTFHYDSAYRILYSFPLGVLTVLLLETIVKKTGLQGKLLPIATALIVLLVAAPYKYPWRGRLFFQIHRPKATRALVHLDETAEWFYQNRKEAPRACHYISDDLSNFSLYTHLGKRKFDFDRPYPLNFLKSDSFSSLSLQDKLKGVLVSGRTTCGVLIARKKDIPPPAYSIVSIEGRLWPPQRADHKEYLADDLDAVVGQLKNRGWTKTEVPPYYNLYEPPYLNDLPEPIFFPAE